MKRMQNMHRTFILMKVFKCQGSGNLSKLADKKDVSLES